MIAVEVGRHCCRIAHYGPAPYRSREVGIELTGYGQGYRLRDTDYGLPATGATGYELTNYKPLDGPRERRT